MFYELVKRTLFNSQFWGVEATIINHEVYFFMVKNYIWLFLLQDHILLRTGDLS